MAKERKKQSKSDKEMELIKQGMMIASIINPVPGTGGGVLHGGDMTPAMREVIEKLKIDVNYADPKHYPSTNRIGPVKL